MSACFVIFQNQKWVWLVSLVLLQFGKIHLGIGIRNIFGECLEENKCGEIFVEIVSNFLFLNGEILFFRIGVGDVVPTKLNDSKMCKEKIPK